jgi:putative inorganic carbon (HCO3(-)) transporter
LGLNKIPLSAGEAKIKILNRMQLWNLAINTIKEHPIFGIGMNYIRKNPQVRYEQAHVHNHFLHTAAELGIPGLIAYLAILIGVGFMCFEIWRKSKVVWIKMAALGLGCGQLAHFIFGMADSIPLGAKVGIFFWFSLALIAAMYNYMLKSNEASKLKQKSS